MYSQAEMDGLGIGENSLADGTTKQYDSIWINLWLPYIASDSRLRNPCLLDIPDPADKVRAFCFGLDWINKNKDCTYVGLGLLKNILKRRIINVSPGSDTTFLESDTIDLMKRDLSRTCKPVVKSPRMPVTYDMVEYIRRVCWTNYQTFEPKADEAKIKMKYLGSALAFNFMLRVSEYTASKDNKHTLLAKNVSFVSKQSDPTKPTCWTAQDIRNKNILPAQVSLVNFNIATSKTDQPGVHNTGRLVSLNPTLRNEFELLEDLISWCKISFIGMNEDDIFLSRYYLGKNYKLISKDINSILGLTAVHFGLESIYFKPHSLRIGGVSAKSRAGNSVAETKKVAGFASNSNAVNRYDRLNVHDKGAFSAVDSSSSHEILKASDISIMQQQAMHSNNNEDNIHSAKLMKRSKNGTFQSKL